ncbi:hypothetical protein KIN20_015339 [Parelaphostrongylus tenuis]|uniref:Uncharacterized protein n=1 Tax=Parelaphostrongylus tenuis TaxID=148309 RepID=A0AAD5QM62_PARTN|nr:hypothetical protein KIN20_015339 [Parelaphostrongylus tenuis]
MTVSEQNQETGDQSEIISSYNGPTNVIVGYFNAKVGPRTTCDKRHIGSHGLECNEHATTFDRVRYLLSTQNIIAQAQGVISVLLHCMK